MLDYRTEKVYPLSEFVRELAATRNIDRSEDAVRRWIVDGATVNGSRVTLDAVRVNRSWHTSIEAFDRFVAAQNREP